MPAEGPMSGKRILVVEDEVIVAMLLEDILADAGATVVGPAARVARALELLEAEPVDAALLDLNLAGEVTIPVAEELKRRGIPFAFATGYGKGLELPPKLAEAASVVPKPYRRQDIAELVGRTLRCGEE